MNTLTCKLSLSDSGQVHVSADQSSSLAPWHDVVEFIQRRCPQAHVSVPRRHILVDWWDFSGSLDEFRDFNRLHKGIRFELDENTRFCFQQAVENRKFTETSAVAPLSASQVEASLEEAGFGRRLTADQSRNVGRLMALPHGATFSVPGAGKTTEALAYFTLRKLQFDPALSRLFVVCPKNAFPAWDEQVEACFGPDSSLRPIRLIGGESNIRSLLREERDQALYVITYQQLASGSVTSLLASSLSQHPSALFLDESHRIKRGQAGTWANAVASVCHLPALKLIMSGTPMPNGISDLVPQFRFLYTGVNSDCPDLLDRVRRCSVRTTKAELGLPVPIQKRVEIPMTLDQARLYTLLADKAARQMEASISSRQRNALRRAAASYQLLLQAVTDPTLLSHRLDSLEHDVIDAALASDSPKFAYACERARRLAAEGRKVLIWTNFVSNVETLARRLADLNAVYIHGGVETRSIDGDQNDIYGVEVDEWDTDWTQEDATREDVLHRFHNDKTCRVLVANPQACAEGISLHQVCHHAIYIDRNYQAAAFLQSQDRIHRLGLPENTETTLEYLVSPGTIDESVDRRLNQKIAMMVEVLNDPSISPPATPTPLEEMERDIRDLLSLLRGNTTPTMTSQ